MAGSGAEAAVFARGLKKGYAGRVAVDGIDFEVRPGICFGFLGPNGAGKTTTMKMIYGLAAVEGGELRVLGLDARRQRREIKSRIGVVPQLAFLGFALSWVYEETGSIYPTMAIHALNNALAFALLTS